MSAARKKPESLQDVMKKLIKQLGLEETVNQQKAMLMWNESVGEKIAKVAIPEKIEHGRLYVRVENNAWKQEIHYLKHEIIKRINAGLKSNIVSDIILI